MKPVFVDTGGWFAAVARRDSAHPLAATFLRQWTGPLITTDYVLDETLTLIQAKIDHTTAVRLLDSLRSSPSVSIEFLPPAEVRRAWQLFRDRPDQGWSLTDCSSFVFMESRQLTHVLAFDRHFRQAGYLLVTDEP